MSRKTITNFCIFVISFSLFCLTFSACSAVSTHSGKRGSTTDKFSADYEKPKVAGKIESAEITESSGIVASRCNEKIFWTHNDSGDAAFLFALNDKGEKLGTWKVSGASNKDWEDIAAFKSANGECFLYIGDIGNNELSKSELTIYRVKEPKTSDADKSSSKKNPSETEKAEAIKFSYPDGFHNAETLLVHPQTGDVYVLSKNVEQPSSVYKLTLATVDSTKINTLTKIADFAVPAVPNGLLTGGDISPDGNRVVLCDYFNGYEITLPANAKNFDEIWTQKPTVIELGEREQGEAVCYSIDGKSIYATSEKRNQPFIVVNGKR